MGSKVLCRLWTHLQVSTGHHCISEVAGAKTGTLRLASRRLTPFIWLLSNIVPFRFAPVCIQPFAR